MSQRMLFLPFFFFFLAAGCGMAADSEATKSAGGSDNDGRAKACATDYDCAQGQWCVNGQCVSTEPGAEDDGEEPEKEAKFLLQPPVGSPHYVFVVNTTLGTVAKITPSPPFKVSSIEVGTSPVALQTVPGKDVAVVLNTGSASLSIIYASEESDYVNEVFLSEHYTGLALSPDGAYAVAYLKDATQPEDRPLIGKVSVISVPASRTSDPEVRSFACGTRITDVVFSGSDRAFLVGRADITVLRLDERDYKPERIRFEDEELMDMDHREVEATPDGKFILIRSSLSPLLAMVDTEADVKHAVVKIELAGIPTDLDINADGKAAVAVIPQLEGEGAGGEIDIIRIPADIFDPTMIIIIATTAGAFGQVVLPPKSGERRALLFTNATYSEKLFYLDLAVPEVEEEVVFLEQAVYGAAIAPDGKNALVLHTPGVNPEENDSVNREIDANWGYTMLDMETSITTYEETRAMPMPFVFSVSGDNAAVVVHDQNSGIQDLHVLDLRASLRSSSLTLGSPPQHLGILPAAQSSIAYVAQDHWAGRITFVDLATSDPVWAQTITGYEVMSDIE